MAGKKGTTGGARQGAGRKSKAVELALAEKLHEFEDEAINKGVNRFTS